MSSRLPYWYLTLADNFSSLDSIITDFKQRQFEVSVVNLRNRKYANWPHVLRTISMALLRLHLAWTICLPKFEACYIVYIRFLCLPKLGLLQLLFFFIQPNCVAEVVRFEREQKIIIISNRRIEKGEEVSILPALKKSFHLMDNFPGNFLLRRTLYFSYKSRSSRVFEYYTQIKLFLAIAQVLDPHFEVWLNSLLYDQFVLPKNE